MSNSASQPNDGKSRLARKLSTPQTSTNQPPSLETSCPTRSDWAKLLSGEVDDEQRTALEDHLSDCPVCEECFDLLTRTTEWDSWNELLTAADEDLPLDFNATLPNVPGYKVEEEIGRGGMGVVYRARHLSLDRWVALKTLAPGSVASPERFARFEAEARAVAKLDHPGIVSIHDVGIANGIPFLTLSLVQGCCLGDVIDQQTWTPRQCVKLVGSLARTLAHVHAQQIVHRDLKPSNILLEETDRPHDDQIIEWQGKRIDIARPRLTDFGLAKQLLSDSDTRTGELLGSTHYISPENAAGERDWSSPANDIYSLGVILYQLLTGRLPFSGPTVASTLREIVSTEATPPSNERWAVPLDLQTICLKCLEKRPEDRYASANDLAEDLRRFDEHLPIRARRLSVFGRARRWIRRHVAITSLLALTFIIAATSMAKIWQQQFENAKATTAQRTAEKRVDQMESEVSLGRYVRQISDVNHALWARDYVRVDELLNSCAPSRRSWEWSLLRQLSREGWRELPSVNGGVFSVAASADGSTYSVADNRGRLEIRSDTGSTTISLSERQPPVFTKQRFVQVPVDDRRVEMLVVCTQHAVMLVSPESGEVLPFEAWGDSSDDTINDFAVSPNGKRLVVCSAHGRLSSFDVATQKQLVTNSLDRADLLALDFPEDDSQFSLLTSKASRVDVDIDTMSILKEATYRRMNKQFAATTNLRIRDFSTSYDGSLLAIVYEGDTRIELVDAITNVRLSRLVGHAEAITDVAFSKDNQFVATGDSTGLVKVWSTQNASRAPIRLQHTEGISSLCWRNNTQLLVGDGSGHLIELSVGKIERQSIMEVTACSVASGHDRAIRAFELSPCEKYLLSSCDDGRVFVRDSETLDIVRELETHPDRVRGVAMTDEGDKVVTACNDGRLRWFDLATGQLLGEMKCFSPNCTALAKHPKLNQFVVAGGRANSLKLFDQLDENAEPTQVYEGHFERTVRDMDYHPDGTSFVVAGGPEVHGFNSATDACLFDLAGHEGRSIYTEYSADGRWIMTFSSDGRAVRVWNGTSHQQHFIAMNRIPVGMTSDCRRFVVRSATPEETDQKFIELIDIESGFVVWKAPAGSSLLQRFIAKRDNSRIYARDSENRIHCWHVVVQ